MDILITFAALAAYVLLCATVVAGLVVWARVIEWHDARNRRLRRAAFEERQAKAREDLAAAMKLVAPVAVQAGLTLAQMKDALVLMTQRPSAREPETAPAAPDVVPHTWPIRVTHGSQPADGAR